LGGKGTIDGRVEENEPTPEKGFVDLIGFVFEEDLCKFMRQLVHVHEGYLPEIDLYLIE